MRKITDLMNASVDDLAVAFVAVGTDRRKMTGGKREVAENLHEAASTIAEVAASARQDQGADETKLAEVWMRAYLGSLAVLTMAAQS